jgi:hypothetical protein
MRCPKCGYHSFDFLESCKKCGHDLAEHKARFKLEGFIAPAAVTASSQAQTTEQPGTPEATSALEEERIDFGFDFLDQENEGSAPSQPEAYEDESFELDLDQDFDIDNEKLPSADEDQNPSGGKPDKGSEFAF